MKKIIKKDDSINKLFFIPIDYFPNDIFSLPNMGGKCKKNRPGSFGTLIWWQI